MKTSLFALGITLLLATASMAQPTGVTTMKVPLSGTVVLRDVKDPYNAQVVRLEAPGPDDDGQTAELAALKEQSARQFPYRLTGRLPAAMKTTAVQQPLVTIGFVADTIPGIPPDNHLAVNNSSQAVAVMNSNIAILNSATGEMTFRKGLAAFSLPVGLNNSPTVNYNDRYDPKVMYDPAADKFICVMLNGTNEHNYIIVAFSATNDPAGAWNFYKFYGDYGADGTWFDYPSIAITRDEFFLTGNKLVYNGSFQTGFVRSVIYQMRKSDGYNGLPLTSRIWDGVNYGGQPVRNLFPVTGGGHLKGPYQYFLSVRNVAVQNDSVFLIRIPDTIGSAGNNLTVQAFKSNLIYGIPPDGRQPDTSDRLQTNDGRVLGAFAEGGEIQFVSTTVHPASGSAAIYHGRITDYNFSPAVKAAYVTVDTMDFGYPNLSYAGTVNGLVTSIISFDYSGPHTYPGLGAVFYDGTGYSDLLKVKAGISYIHILTGAQRWGDYTGSQPAWSQPGSVWVAGIYGRKGHDYGNWMAQLRSPTYAGEPAPGNAVLYPNPSFQYIRIAFTLDRDEQVRFAIYNTSGQLVDNILEAACETGRNELQFNVGTLEPGHYFVKATGAGGASLFAKSFIRN